MQGLAAASRRAATRPGCAPGRHPPGARPPCRAAPALETLRPLLALHALARLPDRLALALSGRCRRRRRTLLLAHLDDGGGRYAARRAARLVRAHGQDGAGSAALRGRAHVSAAAQPA